MELPFPESPLGADEGAPMNDTEMELLDELETHHWSNMFILLPPYYSFKTFPLQTLKQPWHCFPTSFRCNPFRPSQDKKRNADVEIDTQPPESEVATVPSACTSETLEMEGRADGSHHTYDKIKKEIQSSWPVFYKQVGAYQRCSTNIMGNHIFYPIFNIEIADLT